MANPVSSTAWYCCGVRAEDAARKHPICGDQYAQRFMDAHGSAIYARFARFEYPKRSNAARARIIDDWLREALAQSPSLRVVLIGCGFDSRAFRLQGGTWLEVDEAPLIGLKALRLPAHECPNPLTRIAIDFARESLDERLSEFAHDGATIVVVEGVLMYLQPAVIEGLFATLARLWPAHRLYADVMDRRFLTRYGGPLYREIARLGARFDWVVDDPDPLFTASGYVQCRRESPVLRAVALGALQFPRWLLRTLLRSLVTGYTVREYARARSPEGAGAQPTAPGRGHDHPLASA